MKSCACAARAAASIAFVRQAAAHVDVFARRGGQQERVLRHQAHVGAEVLIVDAVASGTPPISMLPCVDG